MAQYGNNPYGDELRPTDNPVHHPTGGEYGHPTGGQFGGTHIDTEHQHGAPHGVPHTTDVPRHRRSGSSSSSSSEDDGMGGRRKKGMKDKIKDKLPGGHKDTQPQTAAPAGYGGVQGHAEPEKKGMMDKIKEKLPGGH